MVGQRTIIAGSRSIRDFGVVCRAIEASGFSVAEVVSGGACGVDRLAERYARLHRIPVRRFLPDWSRFGRSAGPRRNQQMVDYAGGAGQLIAVWDGRSRGTQHTIQYGPSSGPFRVCLPCE
jgi:hypothetical protein